MRPDLVMKFGGTSLATAEAMQRAADHVLRETREKLVIVSAVGGVTDMLLQSAAAAGKGDDFRSLVREIKRRHSEIIEKCGLTEDAISTFQKELERLLTGVSMLSELSPRTRDALVALGECMSASLFTGVLVKRGVDARAMDAWDLGMITDERYGCASPLDNCHEEMARKIAAVENGVTPVITGFIGHTSNGEVTSLGRGGSDFSAALFGAAAKVREIQIWTDVSGILRADPRVVPGASVLQAIRFEEAAELAYFGARVLHPRTIEPARRAGIPVRVLGTFQVDPDGGTPVSKAGTLIDDLAPPEKVRALAIQREVQSLYIHSLRMLDAPGFLSRVFEILARHMISVDVIATSEVSVSMTLDRYEGDVDEAIEEISTFAEVKRRPDRSMLCLVGSGLRDDTGILARVFGILAANRVPVYVISQGASRINITLVTDPEHIQVALRALYVELFQKSP